MKTTELFIDQLLIGLLVVVTVLALSPMPIPDLASIDLGSGAAFAGTAYFTGILYDRFADTMLQDQERHNRLVHAILKCNKTKSKASPDKDGDYFPVGRYRMAVLHNGQASDYADYLRSRLRLTRALASLLPAMSVALVAYLGETLGTHCVWNEVTAKGTRVLTCTFPGFDSAAASAAPAYFRSWDLLALVAIVYGLVFVLQLLKPDLIRRKRKDSPYSARRFWGKPPRTKLADQELEIYTRLLGGTDDLHAGFNYRRKAKLFWLVVVKIDPAAFIGAAVLFGIGGYLALRSDIDALALIPVAGVLLTLLTGWTWWRIHDTFLNFVRRFAEYPAESKQATSSG